MRDERGFIGSGATKVVLVLLILGVAGFDGGAVLVNNWTLDSAADDTVAALALSIETDDFGTNDNEVYLAAQSFVVSPESNAQDATVVQSGTGVDDQGIIQVTLERPAKTLVAHRIEVFRKWAVARVSARASTN